MKWPMEKLSEVCQVNPRLPKDSDESQEVSFLAMASISEDGVLLNQETRILGETKKGFTYFERGDVIVAKITPCFENGKAAYLDSLQTKIGFGSTEFHVLRPDIDRLDGKYLFYLIWNDKFRFIAERSMSGSAGQKRVPAKFLQDFSIPLPPLEEQKRIAAILDKADAIRQKRQEAIALADDFLRSVFLDMFGDDISSENNVVSLGDVVTLDAPMVDPREEMYADLLHIGPDRIEKNTGRLLPALTAREEGLISKKFLFNDEYVLYSKIRPYLKKVAISNFTGLCSADMYPVKPVDGKTTKEFLWMLLLSDLFDSYIKSLAERANIPKLNRKELASFKFSLPEFNKIKIFTEVVIKTTELKNNNLSSECRLDSMFNSLSQKAFSGQL